MLYTDIDLLVWVQHNSSSMLVLTLSVNQNAATSSSCSHSRAVGVEDTSGGYGCLEFATQRGHLLAAASVHIDLQSRMQDFIRVMLYTV